jgi:hypothetical protein
MASKSAGLIAGWQTFDLVELKWLDFR